MIYEFLKVGKQNALGPDYIKNALGFSSIREVQKQVERERSQGKVILSSTVPPGGYYLPANGAEIRRFIRTLENRGSRTLEALNGARKLLGELERNEVET